MSYQRASDEDLRKAGYDPEWIIAHAQGDPDGPYFAVCISKPICPACGQGGAEWTVLNVQTAIGGSHSWYGANAQYDAEEHAADLNAAWYEGFDNRHITVSSVGVD